jgi:hypothetical protein
MARKQMNTLWFTRAEQREGGDVTFLFTAKDEAEARAKCLAHIAEPYRQQFTVTRAEVVCQTPDTVDCFEPV